MPVSKLKEPIYSLKKNIEDELKGQSKKSKRKNILERLKYIFPDEDSILRIACYDISKNLGIPEEEINKAISFGRRPEEQEEIRKYWEKIKSS